MSEKARKSASAGAPRTQGPGGHRRRVAGRDKGPPPPPPSPTPGSRRPRTLHGWALLKPTPARRKAAGPPESAFAVRPSPDASRGPGASTGEVAEQSRRADQAPTKAPGLGGAGQRPPFAESLEGTRR